MWEESINIYQVREIRTRVKVYFGVGAIEKADDVAAEMQGAGIQRVLVVTGAKAYKQCGAWARVEMALKRHEISWVCYNGVTPNPTVDQVDAAVFRGRAMESDAVIAIGGGSAIDAGKAAAVLLAHPGRTARELCELEFQPIHSVPLLAVNLTHGTGTEVDRFAVVTIPEKEFKPALAYECMYPRWSIDDPNLMTGLSVEQTRYVSIDAVNHVIEAATTRIAGAYTVMLARETIRLAAHYLPVALKNPDSLEARYYLLFASMIAGVAFDNGLLHFTHALEHPLSAMNPRLTHGKGLAMLLPAVVRQIYPVSGPVLAEILSPLIPGLKGYAAEADRAALGVERWLFSCGATEKLSDAGFTGADIPHLVRLTDATPSLSGLLALAPVEASQNVIRTIYENSLHPADGARYGGEPESMQ